MERPIHTRPSTPPMTPLSATAGSGVDSLGRDEAAIRSLAHRLLAAYDEHRALQNLRGPRGESKRYYLRRAQPVLATLPDRSIHVAPALGRALARYAHSSNSYHTMMAALKWTVHEGLRARMQAATQEPGAERGAHVGSQWPFIGWLCTVAEALGALNRRQLQADHGVKGTRPKSKRRDLPHLPAGWQQLVVDESAKSPTFGPAVALLPLTGLRPWELERGVHLQRDGHQVVLRVQGAKVTAGTGQPWRELRLLADALPTWMLTSIDPEMGAWIQVDRDSLRTHLRNVSLRLQPKLKAEGRSHPGRPLLISAYTFRHAFVEALREAGWDTDQIALALGHCAAETQAQYGRRGRRRRGYAPRTLPLLSATAARQVRRRPTGRFAALFAHNRGGTRPK